jgi:hypothetical protein
MRVWLGKLLELVGMMVVLAGFLYGLKFNVVRFELAALAIGSLIFVGGWYLEKKT